MGEEKKAFTAGVGRAGNLQDNVGKVVASSQARNEVAEVCNKSVDRKRLKHCAPGEVCIENNFELELFWSEALLVIKCRKFISLEDELLLGACPTQQGRILSDPNGTF